MPFLTQLRDEPGNITSFMIWSHLARVKGEESLEGFARGRKDIFFVSTALGNRHPLTADHHPLEPGINQGYPTVCFGRRSVRGGLHRLRYSDLIEVKARNCFGK